MKTINVTEKEVQAAFAAAKSEETKQVLTTLFGQQKETAKPTIDNYKQFDLQEYLKNPNREVITRDGESVRIICTDMIGNPYPVLAICKVDPTHECCKSYTTDGKLYTEGDSQADLFFAPEKKEGWANLFNLSEGPCLGRVYSSKEVAEAMSKNCGLHPYIATIKIEWEE
nr:MAG TPA: hypothetical protein [Caudoviricetes sp.]